MVIGWKSVGRSDNQKITGGGWDRTISRIFTSCNRGIVNEKLRERFLWGLAACGFEMGSFHLIFLAFHRWPSRTRLWTRG